MNLNTYKKNNTDTKARFNYVKVEFMFLVTLS